MEILGEMWKTWGADIFSILSSMEHIWNI